MTTETILTKQEIRSIQHNHPSLVPLFESRWKDDLEYFARALLARYGNTAQPTAAIRDQIREVLLRHGYTIKPGQDDLKDYVYAAAEELIQRFGNAGQSSEHTDQYDHPIEKEWSKWRETFKPGPSLRDAFYEGYRAGSKPGAPKPKPEGGS